jgi:hypothetical protein
MENTERKIVFSFNHKKEELNECMLLNGESFLTRAKLEITLRTKEVRTFLDKLYEGKPDGIDVIYTAKAILDLGKPSMSTVCFAYAVGALMSNGSKSFRETTIRVAKGDDNFSNYLENRTKNALETLRQDVPHYTHKEEIASVVGAVLLGGLEYSIFYYKHGLGKAERKLEREITGKTKDTTSNLLKLLLS